jgi:hypothetical protein
MAGAKITIFLPNGNAQSLRMQDYEFSSPSAAAAIIHGGHANGLAAWRTSDGKTLKEIEAAV